MLNYLGLAFSRHPEQTPSDSVVLFQSRQVRASEYHHPSWRSCPDTWTIPSPHVKGTGMHLCMCLIYSSSNGVARAHVFEVLSVSPTAVRKGSPEKNMWQSKCANLSDPCHHHLLQPSSDAMDSLLIYLRLVSVDRDGFVVMCNITPYEGFEKQKKQQCSTHVHQQLEVVEHLA